MLALTSRIVCIEGLAASASIASEIRIAPPVPTSELNAVIAATPIMTGILPFASSITVSMIFLRSS